MPNLDASSVTARNLARALPDAPGWVDTRGMLLSGRATIIGGATVDAGFVVRVMAGALAVVSGVGYPAYPVIAQAVEDASRSSCCPRDTAVTLSSFPGGRIPNPEGGFSCP